MLHFTEQAFFLVIIPYTTQYKAICMPSTLYYILKVIKNNFKYIGHANTKSFYIKNMTIHGLWHPQWLLKPIKLRRDRRIDTFP